MVFCAWWKKTILIPQNGYHKKLCQYFQPYTWCMERELLNFSAIGIETVQQNPSASKLWPKM